MAFGSNVPPIQVHLCVKGGADAIAFYERAFGASCQFRQMAKDGHRILHANLSMFGGEVMLHDEFPEFGGDVLSPVMCGGASAAININLPTSGDVDRTISQAVAAGAVATLPPGDQFWGARYGRISDPFGHVWAFNAPLAPASANAS